MRQQSSSISVPQQALAFDLDALYKCLRTIPDHRDPRGRQYPLAMVLMIGVLAKLAGQDSSRAMAHWAKLRTAELSQLFQFERKKMPHYSTWSRVLGHSVEPAEVEQRIGQFFVTAAGKSAPRRGSIQLALDGKTLAERSRREKPVASICWRPTCPHKASCWRRCVLTRRVMRLPMPPKSSDRWICEEWW